jgi:hypothetical protein
MVLISQETLRLVTSRSDLSMGILTQRVVDGCWVEITTDKPERLIEKNLPTSIKINLNEDPKKINGGKFLKTLAKHSGFVYPDNISEWFSSAIDRKVYLIHAPADKRNPLPSKQIIHGAKDDFAQAYLLSALHIIDEASVRDLRERVAKRHPGEEHLF